MSEAEETKQVMQFLRNTRNVVGEVTVRINLFEDELLSDDLGAGLAKHRG